MGNGLLDQSTVTDVFKGFYGYEVEVSNTPEVHPKTVRIYITAAGDTHDVGVLYGTDVLNEELEVTCFFVSWLCLGMFQVRLRLYSSGNG